MAVASNARIKATVNRYLLFFKVFMLIQQDIIFYYHGFGGLKPPALAGSFSVSS
jgi:hypothetical protein